MKGFNENAAATYILESCSRSFKLLKHFIVVTVWIGYCGYFGGNHAPICVRLLLVMRRMIPVDCCVSCRGFTSNYCTIFEGNKPYMYVYDGNVQYLFDLLKMITVLLPLREDVTHTYLPYRPFCLWCTWKFYVPQTTSGRRISKAKPGIVSHVHCYLLLHPNVSSHDCVVLSTDRPPQRLVGRV